MKINVIYEDNHLIVVEKPANILIQAGSLNLPDLLNEVKKYIKEKYNKPGEVFLGLLHRLDTNVAGIVCFAKTSKAASRVSKEIRELRFDKKYLAIVEGNLKKDEAVLKDFLYKDEINKKAIISDEKNGKESILKYKKIARIDNLSLLDIELITGRFHQIRAQLSNQNTPIYGDKKYKSKNRYDQIALYAYYLSFVHPTTKEKLEFKHYPKNPLFDKFLNELKLKKD